MSELIPIQGEACTETCCCTPKPTPQVLRLQYVTLAWMAVECGVAVYSAAKANSIVLLAFGSDSFVEMLSAIVVLLQFFPRFPLSKHRAAVLAGALLIVLAVIITLTAILALFHGVVAEASPLGIAISIAALVAMPLLARAKRRAAHETADRALAADATQSATCAYLALVTLAGLVANAWLHIHWIDSVAALVAVPILLVEARRALRGESCGCC